MRPRDRVDLVAQRLLALARLRDAIAEVGQLGVDLLLPLTGTADGRRGENERESEEEGRRKPPHGGKFAPARQDLRRFRPAASGGPGGYGSGICGGAGGVVSPGGGYGSGMSGGDGGSSSPGGGYGSGMSGCVGGSRLRMRLLSGGSSARSASAASLLSTPTWPR